MYDKTHEDHQGEPPDAVFQDVEDVAWLPAGSRIEMVLGDAPVDGSLVTSAFAVAFDAEERMLLASVLSRGLDFPGGHVETGETPEEAARREVSEETGAQVRIGRRIGHLRLVVPHPPEGYSYPVPVSIQTFHEAEILSMGVVSAFEECAEPAFVPVEDVLADPRFQTQRAFVSAALKSWRRRAVLGGTAPCP